MELHYVHHLLMITAYPLDMRLRTAHDYQFHTFKIVVIWQAFMAKRGFYECVISDPSACPQ